MYPVSSFGERINIISQNMYLLMYVFDIYDEKLNFKVHV